MYHEEYILNCFYTPQRLVIESVQNGHIVTITPFDCRGENIHKHFYVFIEKRTDDKRYMALGLKTETKWCRFDICLDCRRNTRTAVYNPDTTPKVGFFHWPEVSNDNDIFQTLKNKF